METTTKIDYWLNTDICEYYDNEEYLKDYCECTEQKFPTNDDERWDLAAHIRDMDLEDFWHNLKYSKFNTYCIITGQLGLWDGRHEIRPVFCTSLEDALHKCFNNMDDAQCYVEDGVIHAVGLHHDGSNHFEIRILKDEYIDKVDSWFTYETLPFPFKLERISQYVDYIY